MTRYPTVYALKTSNGTRYLTVIERYVDSYKPSVALESELYLHYDWEWDLASKLRSCAKVVDPVGGVVGYVYRNRLIIPDQHLGGRTPDAYRHCDFPKVSTVAMGYPVIRD